ncbi:MAG: endopeptidase La, partial [Bacteroidaceae bacterium]|nr:endopeptidase La [Bacteroidaceae bacterium]
MIDKNRKSFSFAAEVNGDVGKMIDASNEGCFPLLVLRDNVIFPGVVTSVHIGRRISIKTMKYAERHEMMVAVFTQKDPDIESPAAEDILPYGVVARLIHLMETPDGETTVLLQAFNQVALKHMTELPSHMECEVENVPEEKPSRKEKLEYDTILGMLKDSIMELGDVLDNFPPEMLRYIKGLNHTSFLVNFVAHNMPIAPTMKAAMLAETSARKRAIITLKVTKDMLALSLLKKKIEHKTQSDLDQQQREYFLNQEIRNIQAELGNKDESSVRDEDISMLLEKSLTRQMPQQIEETFQRELNKLKRINMQSPDYNVQLNYLETFVDLPWGIYTTENIDLKRAERRLDKDHYGMETVKERILEHLAVLMLRKDRKSPIICLYGPPGVGKTSLGKSIAAALKREYVRVSLGGMHDESEIRGHRRTYIGAMPGRIIKAIQKAGTSNPVFILDEIDKVTQNTVHGDPSSALLEVLDPEQNVAFHDNFLDVDFDLSHVMFIATANDISTIPTPLRDRMELIEVSGYMTEEKIEIAHRHLVPKKKEENGLAARKDIKVNKAALEFIAERYTRESGVRGLEKQIDKLFRKIALQVASEKFNQSPVINVKEAEKLLGKPRFSRDQYQGNEFAGVVTGLAWTSVGGEILFIETSVSKSKAGKLTLTGNLGDVMKESAMLACEYIRAHAAQWDIDPRVFDQYNLHIHVPEGAVPKDGPSAGVTMATSIVSALTQRKVRQHLAMTGEITLRGKVLPVGGIKEKMLAAKRAGIAHVILCEDNRKDIEEIPQA